MELISDSDEDRDEEVNIHGNKVQRGVVRFISLFLLKMQLAYRLSNSTVTMVLRFVIVLLTYISKVMPQLRDFVSHIPTSLHTLRKGIKVGNQLHTQYSFCPKCYRLYDFKSQRLTETNEHGEEISSKCNYVAFPNHCHRNRRSQCGEPLMKRVKCKNRISRQLYCIKKA